MSNELEFLEGQPSGEDQPVETPAEAAPVVEPPKGPERGPDGKFVAGPRASSPPEATPPEKSGLEARAPEVAAPSAPLSALLDERDRRQRAEAKAAELQARWEEVQRANQPAPTPEASLQAELYAQRLDMSRMVAESRHGADTVAKVHDWALAKCEADPLFNQAMRSSRNPYEAAMQAFNRETIAAKVTPERLAAFEAWESAQAQAQAGQAQPAPTPAAPPPPRSLVNATNAGGAAKVAASENAYEALPFN